MKFKLVDVKEIEDSRGKLVVFEKNTNCPFEVKRAFYMYESSNEAIRGAHANKKSRFFLICVCGSCKVRVNDGYNEVTFSLENKPIKGLFIDKMVWKEMFNFSRDCILFVLSDKKYDPTEYISDFDKFQAYF